MKSLFLPAVLILMVACGRSAGRKAEMAGGRTPEVGVIETVYQVVNEKDRQRVGFVNKVSYDSGRIVFWVYGPDYKEKMGYLLTNNRAFRHVWTAGRRAPQEEELKADTMNSNVRRVLGHNRSVVLEVVDQRKLAAELLKDRYKKPEPEAKKAGEEGDGCGDE